MAGSSDESSTHEPPSALDRSEAGAPEDPRVEAVVEQLEALARTGEDRPLIRPPPLPPEAQQADLPPDEWQEHVEAVRPAKARDVAHPEKKVVINEQRTLSEVAAEAGLSMGDFKALNAGDRRARTMLAARLVDHLDGGVRLRPEAARAALPIRAPAGTQRRPAPAAQEPDEGPLALDALPALEPDGSLIEPARPPAAAARSRPLPDGVPSANPLDGLPSLAADGTVLAPDPLPNAPGGNAHQPDSLDKLNARIRGSSPGRRIALALLALVLVAAVLWAVLVGVPH